MQSTESRQRDDLARARRHRRCNATSGRVLPQPEMSPVFVVIAEVFFQQSSQMSLVQNDHVVQQVSSRTSNPTLGDVVVPPWTKIALLKVVVSPQCDTSQTVTGPVAGRSAHPYDHATDWHPRRVCSLRQLGVTTEIPRSAPDREFGNIVPYAYAPLLAKNPNWRGQKSASGKRHGAKCRSRSDLLEPRFRLADHSGVV